MIAIAMAGVIVIIFSSSASETSLTIGLKAEVVHECNRPCPQSMVPPSIDQSVLPRRPRSLGGRRRVITYALDHVVRALRGGTTLARCIRCSPRPRSAAAATRREARCSRSQFGPYWNVRPHCLSPRATFSGPSETPAERISVKLSAGGRFQGKRTPVSSVADVATPDGADGVKEASQRSLRTLESCQSVHYNGHSTHSRV